MAVFDITFYSNTLHRQTQMTAIVPVDAPDIPGFPKPDPDRKFPALYLLHGYSGAHGDWLRGSRIEQLAMMHSIAVFCPSGENSFYLDDWARDALYGQLLGEELITFTRRLFPLSDQRSDTSIGGLSMGGYGALRNGLKYSGVFGNIIALSSALITDNVADGLESNPMISASYFSHTFGNPADIKGSDIDPAALAQKLVDTGTEKPNIFMACGSEDFLVTENRKLDKRLSDMSYPHVYLEGPGIHSWEFWDPHIEKALVWLNETNQ
jgi:S-formylglutathione hydrolase FrmB